MATPLPTAPSSARLLRPLAALFLAYLAVGAATQLFIDAWDEPSMRAYESAVPWLAAGIGVAGLWRGGSRLWPAVFAASWAIWGGLLGHSPITVTVDAAAEAASAVIIVRLLSAWGFRGEFDGFRDPLTLLTAALVGRLLAVAIDDLGLLAAVWLTPEQVEPAYRALATDAAGAAPRLTARLGLYNLVWALNTAASIALVVPAAVATSAPLVAEARRRPRRVLAWSLGLAAWSVAALTLHWPSTDVLLLLSALALVTWAAAAFGVAAAAIGTLVMEAVATVGFAFRLGPLGTSDPATAAELLWGFIALLALPGGLLAVLLAERRRELAQLRSTAERYRRLFSRNPSPLWVAAASNGRILMVNDEALRHYRYDEAQFRGLTVEQLAAAPAAPVDAQVAGPEFAGAVAVQHKTGDGRLIDVELLSTPIELDRQPAILSYALDVTDRNALRRQLFAAADLERRRLAQELHDGLGQALTALRFGAEAAAMRVGRGEALTDDAAEFLVEASRQAVTLCRELARGVSPLHGAGGDLWEALRRLPDSLPPEARDRVEVTIDVPQPASLTLARSEHLYRIVQEAVTNALKHARAARIRVAARVAGGTVEVSVEDDGVGLPQAAGRDAGFGVRSMQMRAAACGGDLEIAARAGGGTAILCRCPEHEPPPAPAAAPEAAARPAAAAAVRTRRGSPALDYLLRCLLVAIAGYGGLFVTTALAAVIDPRVAMSGARLAVPSLLTGISVAALALGGRRLWPGALLAATVGAVTLLHLPLRYAPFYGVVEVASYLLAVSLLEKWSFGRAFDRWQDPLLLMAAAIVSAALSLVLGFIGVLVYQYARPGDFAASLVALISGPGGTTPVVTGAFLAANLRWWADSVAGIVLVVPMIAATPPLWARPQERLLEVAGWCLALGAWAGAVLLLSDDGARLPLVTVALLLLMWAAVRFGVAWASAATFLCAVAATASFVLQRGVLTTLAAGEGVSALWGFLVLLTAAGSLLTALVAERNRIRNELVATAERYRRLFESCPHPLWLQDAADGRVLMANERALRLFGAPRREWLPRRAQGPAATTGPAAPFPLRALRGDGVPVDLELTFSQVETDGRASLLCLAVDVTERNALRRAFLESADLERRLLAEQLRAGLGQALVDLESATARFVAVAAGGRPDPEAIALIARASQAAASACRRTAHGASPLQANGGDLVQALVDLPADLPDAIAARIDVRVGRSAPVGLTTEHREQLYGLVRAAVIDAVLHAGAQAIGIAIEVEPALIRVSVEDDGHRADGAGEERPRALQMMAQRARLIGARLRSVPGARGGRRVVCECPQPVAPR